MPLLAIGAFASPWMLMWGLAAAIPVLIHLWNRRQQNELRWAAMQFLLAAAAKRSRRLRIEHWTLLAVRAGALLMLAIALADPFLATLPAWPPAATAGRTHTLLVLDGSFSMATQAGRRTCFELARQRAVDLVEAGTQGDGFTLLILSDPPRVVVRDAVFDRQDLANELGSIEVRHTVGGLIPTLSEIERVLDGVRRRHPRLSEHRVVFLTDLGRATWQSIETDAARGKLTELSSRAEISVVPINSADPQSLAITSLVVSRRWPAMGEVVSLQAGIRNFGTRAFRSQLEVFVDDRSIGQREVSIPAGGRQSIAFPHRFSSLGQHMVEARIGRDDLDVDNRRWLSVVVPAATRVLCVEGTHKAAEFIELALDPNADGGTRVEPTVVGSNALLETDLQDYHCVILCDVGRVEQEELDALSQFVRDGGGLVTVLGPRVDIENYNALLAGEDSSGRLLPARLEGIAGDTLQHFDPLEYRHPIAAPFGGHERSGLLTAPTWRYVQLMPLGDRTEVALQFDDGSPALLTAPYGLGRTVVLATAASSGAIDLTTEPPTAWTALPLWPCFPPLIRETVDYAIAGESDKYNTLVGTILSDSLQRGSSTARLSLEEPSGETQQLSINYETSPPRWTFSDTFTSGVYRVGSDRPGEPQRLFAVNVENSEGDLQRLELGALPAELSEAGGEVAGRAKRTQQIRPPSLFRIFLGLALVLLVSESVLAKWIGKGAR